MVTTTVTAEFLSDRKRPILIAVGVLISLAATAQAQDVDATASIECFEHWHESNGIGPSVCDRGVLSVEGTISRWHDFDEDFVNDILDGLEALALSSGDVRVLIGAVVYLASPGNIYRAQQKSGIAARLARVYRTTANRIVKRQILRLLDRQWERAVAAELLVEAAMRTTLVTLARNGLWRSSRSSNSTTWARMASPHCSN